VRQKISLAFESWGGFVARRPWPVLLATLAVCAGLIAQIPNIRIDMSTEGFLHDDDPILLTYNDFRARFDRDDSIVVGIETEDLYTGPFLERLRDFHAELEDGVPHVDEITSLTNARWTRGEGDRLIVEDLMEEWPRSDLEFEALRNRVSANPLYVNLLVSPDHKLTTVEIKLDTFVQTGVAEDGKPELRYLNADETRAVVDSVIEIMARYESPEFRTYAAGGPWLADRIAFHVVSDFGRMMTLSIIGIGTILFVVFGQWRAVFMPLLIVMSSVACTLGLLPLLDLPYQAATQIVPVSLLAIGSGDSVHVLAIYYQRRRTGLPQAESIVAAFGHAGMALLMTSVTTATAMLSFLSAQLAPIGNIGILVPAGVMIAFALTMTLLPALLSLFPERKPPGARRRLAFINRFVVGAGSWATRHTTATLTAAAVVGFVVLAGVVQVRFSHNPLTWFPEDDAFRISTERLNESLGGVMSVEVLIESEVEGSVQNPEFLRNLAAIAEFNETYNSPDADNASLAGLNPDLRISKTVSVADLLKEVNQAVHENRPEHYVLPDTRELTAQELLLFELSGNDDLEELTDYEYKTARIRLRVPWTDATEYGEFMNGFIEEYDARLPETVTSTVTGNMPLLVRTLTAVIESMRRSYIIAFLAVTPLMIVLLGNVRLGLIAMVPNLLPIAAALGLMGWFGISVDAFALLCGSIVLGLAVDDTIHFMTGFAREYAQTHDAQSAVERTLRTTGQALFFTTLILCTGFMGFSVGYLKNGEIFGIVTSFALIVALAADVILSPALVTIAARRGVKFYE
jgi:predicted RND superfamily exporter protein